MELVQNARRPFIPYDTILPTMTILTQPISLADIRALAKQRFGNLIKAVVDVRQGIMAIDADLHADEEAELIAQGSKQSDLWGINVYLDVPQDDMIEFDSMINLRPSAGNTSRSVDDETIRQKIRAVVNKLITR